MRKATSVRAKFMAKYKVHRNGCWEWTSYKDRRGYAVLSHKGKQIRAARLSYRLFVGSLPSHLEVDHLCRNRACVNPKHLEKVTHRVNVLRGETVTAINLRKTHCKNGHRLSGEVIRITKEGWRRCLICKRAGDRRRYRKARAIA